MALQPTKSRRARFLAAVVAKGDRRQLLAAIVAALAVAVVGGVNVSMSTSMGYDEAMHAEAPAARMLVAARMGEWSTVKDALLGCEQYPFAYPLLLALVQACTGLSEAACRAFGRVVGAIALLGIFVLAQRAASSATRLGVLEASRARWAPWIAMLFAVFSPLAVGYSGTLFLEVPFMAASAWAAALWLARRGAEGKRAALLEVAAGALLALAFFTKFNYGILLLGACGLDFLIEGAGALRRGEQRAWLLSAARLAAVPLLAAAWWFVLPLPGGLETAASHRETFWSFLLGNQTLTAPKTFRERTLDWVAGVFANPRAFVLGLAACIAALRLLRAPSVRTVALLAFALLAPVALHPYHLDRFLLPGATFLWVLAALGLAAFLPKWGTNKFAVLAALILACGVRRDLDTRGLPAWVVAPSSPEIAAYQRERIAEQIALSPSRKLPTAGLDRLESEETLDVLEEAVRRDLHVGLLAPPAKLPPAAVQLGLAERGGPEARLLDDPVGAMIAGVAPRDAGWSDEQLAAACAPFDVILASDPVDAYGTPAWKFLEEYRQRLISRLGYVVEPFGPVTLHRPLGQELEVRWFALRRSP